ncbi:MAG: EcsC family protein [Phycisphaerales bacterium]
MSRTPHSNEHRAIVPAGNERTVAKRVAHAIERVIAHVPDTDVGPSPDPARRARAIANAAAIKSAVVSGSLALPPGPLGLLTILPDLVAIWRIQSQMVADIAGAFGVQATLEREQMIYCLFRHAAAQAVRDLMARVGSRIVVRQATSDMVQRICERIGVQLTRRMVSKAAARWLPVIGALGVGAYAFYDTGQVAKTAIELFERETRRRE